MKFKVKKILLIIVMFTFNCDNKMKSEENSKQNLLICLLISLEVNSNRNTEDSRKIATNSVINTLGCTINYENESK